MAYPCGLYIVSGPIGNLSDITLRALETLIKVDFIVSEDTRETSKLLRKYNIKKKQISYREEVHTKTTPKLISLLKEGRSLALISNSGTPLISDPGFKLVREVVKHNFDVIPIPGPSALMAALTASALPTDKFIFLGFLPKSKASRKKILESYTNLDSTIIIYESPYKIRDLLKEAYDAFGNRYSCLSIEMTKIHERFLRGYLKDLISSDFKEKGEFVLLVSKEGYEPE